MPISRLLLRRLFPVSVVALLVFIQSPAFAGGFNWRGGLTGAAEAVSDYGRGMAEEARQKEIIRYQYELEMQRQRLAEESRKQALAKVQQEKEAAEKEAERKAMYTGTGFFVDPTGYIITNAHVVTDKIYVAIRDFNGKFYRATVVAQDKQNDLALLQVDGSFPSLHIVPSEQAEKGQRVLTVGYPQISIQGNESKVTDGIINSFSGIKGDANWFQISVPIQGGNSGGPLVNDNGDVLGVVVASLDVQKVFAITGDIPQNVNYAIKSSLLLNFLSAQQVLNTTQPKGKISIGAVDKATVLVVAKNDPIEVTYEEPPIDPKVEDERLTQLHPNWRFVIQSDGFKKWLEPFPSVKNSFESPRAQDRAKVLDAYNEYINEQKESAIRAVAKEVQEGKEREVQEQLARCNDEVTRTYPDWAELKKNPEFLDWVKSQPVSTRNMADSQNATDIIAVLKLYKEQPAKKLVEVGRVKSVFKQYGYIVFALNDQGYQHIDNVLLLSDGRKIKGIAEKRTEGNVSVTININDMDRIKNDDAVFVSQ